MTIDIETIEATTEQPPSMALTLAAIRAVAAAHPELGPSDHNSRASALVNRGALFMDAQGTIGVKASAVAMGHARTFAPGLIGEHAPAMRSTRPEKAAAQERKFAAVLATRRPPARIDPAAIGAALAEAVKANPHWRSPEKAKERERLTRAALVAAGITPGNLDADGVTS